MKTSIPMTVLDCILGHKVEITLKDDSVIIGFGRYLGESPVSDDSDDDAETLCVEFDNGDGTILFEDDIKSYKLLD